MLLPEEADSSDFCGIKEPGEASSVCRRGGGLGARVMLEELDHVAHPVSEFRGAAPVSQDTEWVCVRHALPVDVRQQVGVVVSGLAQDDLCVICVEIHLEHKK